MSENRVRKGQLKFHVTETEEGIIREKAKNSNMNIERFLRNSALRKNIVVYDLTSIFELSSQISHIGNNINQIARKLNQGEGMYNNDINFLKQSMRDINDTMINLYHDMIEKLEED